MSKKRPEYKVQLGLAALLLIGSSLAYWFEYSKKPKEEALEAASKKPLELKDVQIATIQLSNESRKITLACLDLEKNLCKPGDNSHWEIREPIKFKADDAIVGSLVSTLNNFKPATTVDLSTDTPEKRTQLIAGYKLDPTAHLRKDAKSVTITSKDGVSTTMHFGERHPIEDGLFALVETKGVPNELKVFVIPTYQITPLDQPLTGFRNKQMLSISQSDVTNVEIGGGKNSPKPITIKKDGVNWLVSMNGAPPVAGDNDAIDSVISGAIFLNAKGFASDSKTNPQAKQTLASAKKKLEIKLRDQKGAEQILTLFENKVKDGKKEASLAYATVSNLDPLYEIETTALDRLDKGYNDFRLARLIPTMARLDLRWIETEGKAFTQTIEKDESAWKATKGTLDSSRVEALLDRLTSNAIGSILPKPMPAVEPKVRVAFGPAKANRKFELTFFRKDGHTYAIDEISTQKETYLLRDELTGLIPWDEKAWLQPQNADKPKPHGHP